MQNPPPGAKDFYLTDELGGSSWEVELPDGSTTKYYAQLPDGIQCGSQQISSSPTPRPR